MWAGSFLVYFCAPPPFPKEILKKSQWIFTKHSYYFYFLNLWWTRTIWHACSALMTSSIAPVTHLKLSEDENVAQNKQRVDHYESLRFFSISIFSCIFIIIMPVFINIKLLSCTFDIIIMDGSIYDHLYTCCVFGFKTCGLSLSHSSSETDTSSLLVFFLSETF